MALGRGQKWLCDSFHSWLQPIFSKVGLSFNLKYMIRKIIVEFDNAEATFKEFDSLAEFEASDIYTAEKSVPESSPVPTPEAIPAPEAPVEAPAPVEPAPEN